MFFKRDPKKKLTKAYQKKMEAAMHAMRNGDVAANAFLTQEAQAIKAQVDELSAAE